MLFHQKPFHYKIIVKWLFLCPGLNFYFPYFYSTYEKTFKNGKLRNIIRN